MQTLLAPEDSKRVADEMIAAIKRAEFSFVPSIARCLNEAINNDCRVNFGDRLIKEIGRAVEKSLKK
jgi:hypothetical protein